MPKKTNPPSRFETLFDEIESKRSMNDEQADELLKIGADKNEPTNTRVLAIRVFGNLYWPGVATYGTLSPEKLKLEERIKKLVDIGKDALAEGNTKIGETAAESIESLLGESISDYL